ncbi:MGDG synthase family glycosyltransferase [Clostridium scatologenes]|uniref:Monogalactosyldiacylglycerol synthase n=1 Tax=Clostridium scatologenes TaxID=1548 RepID=A0A0E3K382_CLOSL|nr:glycosyltransferase [Clostridium scatologenes]AKA71068.1 Monogalactosyldiacylglycerol synthase [Clostridium scatologenes]
MKFLILSVSAGGGHGHAAEALKDYINLKIPESEIKIIDTLKYINPIIDKVVIGSYLKTLKVTPSLYGKLYNYSEGDYGITNTISAKFNEIMTYKLIPLIDEFSPNILICTHPFTTEMVSIMKSKYNLNIPVMSIITDYYPHGSWLHSYIDAYVVSNKDMVEDMVSKGIPKNTIHDLGIPVNPSFMDKYKKDDTLKELNLNPSKFTILVMGGSLGMGKITDVYHELNKVNKDIQIIVITGKNEKLYNELSILEQSSIKPTKIIGFTDKVNKYMQACDLLLTKPGGLTITEALICGIPLGIFSPIPGQEEKNAEFLLNHNLAINLSDTSKCQEIIESLLQFEDKLAAMKSNCSKFSKPDSGDRIVELIKYLIKNKSISSLKNFDKDYEKDNNIKTFFKSVEEYFMKTAIKIFANN